MSLIEYGKIEDLEKEDMARLVMDMFHRIIVHYGMWFNEVRHQVGPDAAMNVMDQASQRSMGIQMKKLSQVLGFELKDGIPTALLRMEKEKLLELMGVVGKNWLANDGVWFQSVEFMNDMNDAKRCNDSCWARFSPFEAWSIKKFLGLGPKAGLEGLKQALSFRIYSRINTQSFEEEQGALVFRMDQCRVQAARNRKKLDDYPCKSGGLVEYTTFARAIDSRIKTQCLACPPDQHPEDWYCAWRFTIDEN